ALVPGTSRSGITITAGLLMGLSREGAARFSFLLAVPVTALAGGLKMVQLAAGPEVAQWSQFALGALLSGLTAFLCIHYFLKWLTRFGMLPYVIYRLVLGALLVALFVV
ncbi:MAG: undecaprenyl-diphosphate phosphatase, partial [Gammaproteobacteria bacterium]